MIESVNKIVNLEFKSIIKDGRNTMLLLGLYSKLYLNGQAPKTCEAQMLKYYNQLKTDGIMKAELQQEIKERTLTPNWVGHKHLKGGHIVSSITITDKQAVLLLDKKILKDSDFKTLPESYNSKSAKKKEVKK